MRYMNLSKGQKANTLAFVAVMAMTAGLSLLVMSGVEGFTTILSEVTSYTLWVAFAGAVGGGAALYAARGWMGETHAMGWVRAIVGSMAAALIAAVVAGTLILPVYGTFYGPVMLVSAAISAPWFAAIWFAVFLAAHSMMITRTQEIALGGVGGDKIYASSQLSSLTRAQLYRNR